MLLCIMTLLVIYLGQSLTPNLKTRVLGKTFAYGDEWLGNESVGKWKDEIANLPLGIRWSQL